MFRSFIGYLKSDLRRCFGGWLFWCAAILMGLLQFFASHDELLIGLALPTHPVHFIQYALRLSDSQLLAPAIVSSAFSLVFLQDYRSRYYRSLLSRGTLSGYTTAHYCTALLGGACAAILGMFLYYIIITPFCLPWTDMDALKNSALGTGYAFEALIGSCRPFAYAFCLALNRACASMVWTALAISLSAWIPNYFFILLAPVLFSYAESYFTHSLNLISFVELDCARYLYPNPIKAAIILISSVIFPIAIGYFAFAAGVRRRIHRYA